jgi:hypothetical protein
VSGESQIARLHFHPPSGAVAVATALRGREAEAAHARVPLLQLLTGSDPAGAPARCPMHTGEGRPGHSGGLVETHELSWAGQVCWMHLRPMLWMSAITRVDATNIVRLCLICAGLSFWSARDTEDGMVSKLRFPRYAHIIRYARQKQA